jgi:hypothetical protein
MLCRDRICGLLANVFCCYPGAISGSEVRRAIWGLSKGLP